MTEERDIRVTSLMNDPVVRYSIYYNGDLKSDHLKSRLFEGGISNGGALALAIDIL